MIELLQPHEVQAISGSDSERFIALTNLLQRRLEEALADGYEDDAYVQYMMQVSAIADALDIEGIPTPDSPPVNEGYWKNFQASVSAGRTQAALKAGFRTEGMDRVELSSSAEARLRRATSKLRDEIYGVELSEKKRNKLLNRLEELEREIDSGEISVAKALKTVAVISTIFASASTGVAALPDALETVLSMVQVLGEEEEQERRLLLAPPKALPAPARPQEKDEDALDT